MAAYADCANAFDRSSNGRRALATSAYTWRGVIPALPIDALPRQVSEARVRATDSRSRVLSRALSNALSWR
jgi:hypothetical protein